MKTVVGRMALIVLVVTLGSALVFWGCGKKSTTSPTVSGRLYIWSLPDSATVTLDGTQQSGKTPLVLQNVSFAKHIVVATKGNFSAVDTVVVHSGRSTPDTAFCWIPGKVNITSNPANAFVHFVGRHSPLDTVVSTGLWIVQSDTFSVSCSTSTAGYFKAVDTFRIWADSTAKNYILPPTADSTAVWGRDSATGNWQREGPFNKVDLIEVDFFLVHKPPVALPAWIQLVYNSSPVFNDTVTIPDTMTAFGFVLTYGGTKCFPPGTYSLPTKWVVTPHNFLLASPGWTVNTYLLGMPLEPGRIRASIRPFTRHHSF